MTIGEDRVRTKFNPSADGLVDRIKQQSAALIDLCSDPHDNAKLAEQARLWRLAMESFEAGAMWAVKGATFGK